MNEAFGTGTPGDHNTLACQVLRKSSQCQIMFINTSIQKFGVSQFNSYFYLTRMQK